MLVYYFCVIRQKSVCYFSALLVCAEMFIRDRGVCVCVVGVFFFVQHEVDLDIRLCLRVCDVFYRHVCVCVYVCACMCVCVCDVSHLPVGVCVVGLVHI